MKKQYIIVISIVVIAVIALGNFFLFKNNKSEQNNNPSPQMQNQDIEETTIASLAVGNWVSVVAEKSDGDYAASMIVACDDKDSCQTSNSNKQAPSDGEAPTGNPPSGGTAPTGATPDDSQGRVNNMENKTMLSGTITEINSDSIVLSLDTGETATVLISDSTRITKR